MPAQIVERPTPYITRTFAFASAGDTLYCPNGHRFRDPLVWEYGGLRCHHEDSAGQSDCNAMVYMIGGVQDLQGRPRTLLVQVTPREMAEMRHGRMGLHDVLIFLGMENRVVAPARPRRRVKRKES